MKVVLCVADLSCLHCHMKLHIERKAAYVYEAIPGGEAANDRHLLWKMLLEKGVCMVPPNRLRGLKRLTLSAQTSTFTKRLLLDWFEKKPRQHEMCIRALGRSLTAALCFTSFIGALLAMALLIHILRLGDLPARSEIVLGILGVMGAAAICSVIGLEHYITSLDYHIPRWDFYRIVDLSNPVLPKPVALMAEELLEIKYVLESQYGQSLQFVISYPWRPPMAFIFYVERLESGLSVESIAIAHWS